LFKSFLLFLLKNFKNSFIKHYLRKLFLNAIVVFLSKQAIVIGPTPPGTGVIAEGQLKDKKYFIANKILAKHDENYMPPEVSKVLEKSN